MPPAEQGTEGEGWTGGREGGPGVPRDDQGLTGSPRREGQDLIRGR